MTRTEELNHLRELFLSAPESDVARVLAVVFSSIGLFGGKQELQAAAT